MSRRSFQIPFLAALVLASLALAGCGGGGDDTSAPPAETTAEAKEQLTKADLLAQGDAICGEVNAAVGAIGASEDAEIQEQSVQVAQLYIGMVESLRALGTPREAQGFADFSAAAEELAKVEGEVKLAAEQGDTAGLTEAVATATPALEEFQSQAAIYGFEDCSEGPSAPPVIEGGGSGEAEGGGEVAPETGGIEEEFVPEEEAVVPEEEIAPETGGAGGGVEEEGVAPETGGGESGSSGGIGPG